MEFLRQKKIKHEKAKKRYFKILIFRLVAWYFSLFSLFARRYFRIFTWILFSYFHVDSRGLSASCLFVILYFCLAFFRGKNTKKKKAQATIKFRLSN